MTIAGICTVKTNKNLTAQSRFTIRETEGGSEKKKKKLSETESRKR